LANPQLENGYTKIANELLEAICRIRLSDYEHRVFWFIIRKTYGYKKKEDWISQKQIAEDTGIVKQHVWRTIKKLLAKNMIIKTNRKIGIQKDYSQWKLPKQVTFKNKKKLPKQVTQVTHTGYPSNPKRLQKVTHTGVHKRKKENIQKKTIQKKNIRSKNEFATSSTEYRLSNYLYQKILKNNPEQKKPNLQSWTVHIDYMIRIDKRKPEKIKEVIDWCQADSFWYANILSTKKLREKYDQLILQMKNKPNKKQLERSASIYDYD
jgi:phage replication O-like protein O